MKKLLFLLVSFSLHASTTFKRAAFFESVMGCSEITFKEELARISRSGKQESSSFSLAYDQDNHFTIIPLQGLFARRPLCCGTFSQVSLKELRDATMGIAAEKPGTFNVCEGVNTTYESSFHHRVDVAALQADPNNHDAVFQVASNFNALEATSADHDCEEQLLSDYVTDSTQGAAAALSAFGGLLQRRYFLYYSPEQADARWWGQTQEKAVNFLEQFSLPIIMSRAGYVKFEPPWNFPVLQQYEKMQVGVQADVQVIAGHQLNADEQVWCTRPEQRVNQVFTAAIDFGKTNVHLVGNKKIHAWGQLLIQAAYEGTVRWAMAHHKKKVFLTFVGSGAFGNRQSWMVNAIKNIQALIVESGSEVTLIWRKTTGTNDDTFLRWQLQKIVAGTCGVYEQWSDKKEQPAEAS